MFLATTADQRFWDKSEKVLFLGEWCKIYDQKHVWSQLDHEILPYHFDDRSRLQQAYQYLEQLQERYLDVLTGQLNKLHAVNYSKRYWRIVVGLWFSNFSHALYDRYLSIRTAIESGKVTKTWLCDTAPTRPKSRVSYAFETYNQYLYSRIIEELDCFPYQKIVIEENSDKQTQVQQSGKLQRLFKEIKRQLGKGFETFVRQGTAVLAIEFYPKLAKRITSDIVFVGSMYLPLMQQIKLQLSLRQVPYLYHARKISVPDSKPDAELRKQLELPRGDNEFERMLSTLIPDEIPMTYIEDYHAINKKALAMAPKNPKIIMTAYSMNYREPCELWAAYCVEKQNTKFVIAQHGGGFGTARHLALEQHFVNSVDRYYTWGSTLDNSEKVKPMPSFRLSQLKKRIKAYKADGPILWVATTMPRYKIYVESGVAGPHMLSYIAEQQQFLKHVTKEVHDLLIWRYFNDMWQEAQRMRDFDNHLHIQHGHKKQLGKASDFIGQVLRSRLVVHTANETTYLETLAANFPTMMYWNPTYYQVRESLQKYFDRLVEVGILHYTPESAANKVNAVYHDPAVWWYSDDVQQAREQFCQELAYTDDDWLQTWKQELREGLIK